MDERRMIMDELKNFIDRNKADFDEVELPAGHEGRFRTKLEAQKKQAKRRRLAWIFAAAACLGVLFAVQVEYNKEQTNHLCELSVEINEVRLYYNMQLAETIAQMETLYKMHQTPGSLELLRQTQEVIAVNREFENKVLPSLPCSEEALFAMNQHYDASLAGTRILLRQMERIIDMESVNN